MLVAFRGFGGAIETLGTSNYSYPLFKKLASEDKAPGNCEFFFEHKTSHKVGGRES